MAHSGEDPGLGRVIERHRRGAQARATASIGGWTLGLVFLATGALPIENFYGVSACVAGLVAVGLLTPPLLRLFPYRTAPLSVAVHGSEILLYTGVIHYCGGVEGVFLAGMYGAMIGYVGMVLPRPYPFVAATAAAAAFSGLAIAEHLLWIPHRHFLPHAHQPAAVQWVTVTASVLILYVIAAVVSEGSDTTRRARQLLKAQNASLEEAWRAAAAAARLKSEFLANMSHEIRTPLNGVIGTTSVLLTTSLSDEQRAHVETIATSGRALLDEINAILDFSKAEAGAIELETISFDVRRCAREALDIVSAGARRQGLSLDLDISARTPEFLAGDPVRLRQILVNLLSNAVKFTSEGGVTARLDVAPNGDAVLLSGEVEDSGIGIASGDTARLFEPFAQLDASTTRRYGGTGLGLAICVRLLGLMKGTLRHSPRPGGGSVFRFTAELQASRGPVPVAMDEPGEMSYAGLPLRVLVVDDNAVNRTVAVAILKHLGVESDNAESGGEALIRLSECSYDVVLMDLEMPQMDGLEATRRMRASSSRAQPFIAGVSGHAVPEYRDRCLKAGMDEYLTKPIQVSDIEAVLARAMSRRGLGRGRSPEHATQPPA